MIQYKPTTEVDFVVIGSGAAGGIMAKELSVAGFSVVVLEQGGAGAYGHEQDYSKDELLNMFPTGPADRFMSDIKLQPNTFRRNDKEKALPDKMTLPCVLGGGTVTYGGSSWRHLPYEFNEATYEGTIAGTGFADWPITYEEMEPYYTKGEWELGIAGLRVDSPFFAPMSKPYPVPPLPFKASGTLLKLAGAKLGLTGCSQRRCDSQPALSGTARVYFLWDVLGVRMSGEGPVEHGRHHASHSRRDRPM